MSGDGTARVRHLAVFLKGKKPSVVFDAPVSGAMPYVLIENFSGKYTSYTNDPGCVRCERSDTIVVADGANTGLTSTNHEGYIGSTLGVLRPNQAKVNPRYFFFFVQSNFTTLNTRTRGAAVPHLEKELLFDLELSLPPFPEQERIVRILDEAEALRCLRAHADRRTDQVSFAVFTEMFGDPLVNGIRWPVRSLGDICGPGGIKAGPFGSSLKKDSYTSVGPRVYGQEQVIAGDFTVGDYHISEEKFIEMQAYAVQAGDVLVSLVGTIGRAVVVHQGIEPGIINPRLLRIRPPKAVLSPEFLVAIIGSPSATRFFANIAGGITMGVLNATLLKDMRIIVPPLNMQQEYAACTAKINTLAAAQATSRKQLDDLFQSLLHRAFQGEL